jgi:hypothetical protein
MASHAESAALKIMIHLAHRCRWAAQWRRRQKGTEHYWEAYAAWRESWNALQVAKSIYNENQRTESK